MNSARSTNPLLNDNQLKLGLFSFNGHGAAFTRHPDLFEPTWENTVAVAQAADRLGLEAIVPFARWRAFGDPNSPNGDTLDPFAWAAGLGALTEQIAVMSTIHVPVYHPLIVAKTAATIDRITNGRFAMNIVCGWFKPEMEMFGAAMAQHDDRYAMAEEWIDVIQRLWRERTGIDYKGQFYNLKAAISTPMPVQSPRPLLMNAGGSPRGREFAAANCDIAFILAVDHRPEAIKAQAVEYRKMAKEKYGRDIKIWMSSYVIQRDSLAEAQAYRDSYVLGYGDDAAADAFIENNLAHAKTAPAEKLKAIKYEIMAGVGGFPLIGTSEDIANKLEQLSDAGIDGVLLTWLDYKDGLRRFGEDILPRLEARGLRRKGAPPTDDPASQPSMNVQATP